LTSAAGERRRSPPRRALHLALFGLAVWAVALWLVFLWLHRGDPAVWQKDWYCFYTAGEAFLESGAVGTYREQCIDNYFWLYPPYALYTYAVFSLLPPLGYYGVAVVGILTLTAIGLRFLQLALDEAQRAFETLALFVASSAAFVSTIVTGQHAAVLLCGIAGALWMLNRERDVLAGAFLGILGLKPNWAAVFVVWLLVTRRWQTLGGMAAVGGLMIATTLPMGLEVWAEYLIEAPRHVRLLLEATGGALVYPAHKLVTFEAFTRSTIGLSFPSAANVAWILLETVAIVAAFVAWLSTNDARDQIAMTVLVAVGGNPYVQFYDLLVLAAPAAVWWMGRARYARAPWWTIGGAAGGLWVWSWLRITTPDAAWPSLAGGFLAVWIAAEAYRVHRASRAAPVPSSPAGGAPAADLASS